jgi:malonate transporter and related proteins
MSVHSAALGAFAASTVLTMALAHVLCGPALGRTAGEATIGAMAAGYESVARRTVIVSIALSMGTLALIGWWLG